MNEYFILTFTEEGDVLLERFDRNMLLTEINRAMEEEDISPKEYVTDSDIKLSKVYTLGEDFSMSRKIMVKGEIVVPVAKVVLDLPEKRRDDAC